jgi:hypothetical protein
MARTKRLLVIGGGPDVLVARGIVSPGTSAEPGRGTVSIQLALTEDACRSGIRVFQFLGAAIRAGRIRDIARLRLYFPQIVERAPLLHTFLDSLYRAGRRADIARILGKPRRGRKTALPHLAAAIAAAVQREGLRPKAAAAAVAARYGRQLGNVSARTLQNTYSRERELLELYCGPQAVPGSVLTRSRWQPPEQEDHHDNNGSPTRGDHDEQGSRDSRRFKRTSIGYQVRRKGRSFCAEPAQQHGAPVGRRTG